MHKQRSEKLHHKSGQHVCQEYGLCNNIFNMLQRFYCTGCVGSRSVPSWPFPGSSWHSSNESTGPTKGSTGPTKGSTGPTKGSTGPTKEILVQRTATCIFHETATGPSSDACLVNIDQTWAFLVALWPVDTCLNHQAYSGLLK